MPIEGAVTLGRSLAAIAEPRDGSANEKILQGVTNAVQPSHDPFRRHRRRIHPGVTPCHGAEQLSDQADHDHRSGGGGRADRHGRPPHRGSDGPDARPDHPGRECRRRRWNDRHGARLEVGPRRLHARDLAHRARDRSRALRLHQIRRRQRLRSSRPHYRRADDLGVEAGIGGQQRHRAAGMDPQQWRQGRLRTRRYRLRLASVHADADEGAWRADERDSLSRHRARDERPAQQPVRSDVRPDHQHHQSDQGRQDQGFRRHDQIQGLVIARSAAARCRSRQRLRGLGVARDVGAEGIAEGCHRQARRSASGGAQGPQGHRALCEPRHRAGPGGSGDAGSAQGASDSRSAALGSGDQGCREPRETEPAVTEQPVRNHWPTRGHLQSGDHP